MLYIAVCTVQFYRACCTIHCTYTYPMNGHLRYHVWFFTNVSETQREGRGLLVEQNRQEELWFPQWWRSIWCVSNIPEVAADGIARSSQLSTVSSPSQGRRYGPETHDKRQVTQHGCLPSWNNVVYVEEKHIFSTGPTRAAKAEQKSLVTAWLAQRTNQGMTLFICTLWVPIHLSFNSL